MADALSYELSDRVATITIDDGKANALSHEVLDGIHQLLDRAEQEAGAVVLAGRPGRLSGGFDLAVMQGGAEGVRDLVTAGAKLILRLYDLPIPVVVACTGHAVAAGAIILLAADVRVGTEGEFKIGLNEVAIGMPVPRFAVELARHRLTPPQLVPAVNHAHLYAPLDAVDAGYLDEVARPDDVLEVARRHATHLVESCHGLAFRLTRQNLRGDLAARLRDGLDDDIGRFTVVT
ncbi:MAG: crotonase/enoyl-CoA hydratase family protein [Acidimicrobiia bacterium]|nr:crotonase/enoyl-CoA hydratase family protein [Acidimicrobiia bacterium]